MLTCYDASFARALDEAGVDVLLVGDSLGMVIQGHPSTLPVSMDEMEYHTRCVARGNATRLDHRRHAVRLLSRVDRPGGSQCRASHEGGRAHGEARGRRLDGALRARTGRARHPRLRAPRIHAAVGACAGRLPHPGTRGRGGEHPAAARPGTRRRRRGNARDRADAECARARRSPPRFRSPSSASAPAVGCSGQVLVLHGHARDNAGQAAALRAQFLRARSLAWMRRCDSMCPRSRAAAFRMTPCTDTDFAAHAHCTHHRGAARDSRRRAGAGPGSDHGRSASRPPFSHPHRKEPRASRRRHHLRQPAAVRAER